ncbi:helix-turn-helix domain-containing protein [Roseinatronobacter bogoriensis]|uniref:XRE family transcriptional regulator n=2 Tax=Roseinatronobacter TaxID=121820 RepID=A0A2K8KIV0_9RHOB|nr:MULTISPECIES: helix-turn-helix transcriptional regulator [Rhodobaca]ATX66758.1 XRE family transcriptional regulator [Rhodobaca barguzinensis]MBB4206218.1 transcriptional regulator with XRE-family HTH domain [Rhodobaca bogoriensis DSM 18756]TDW40962.1 transcriptional regulator with XRE-family HTH domain [Rhodobaca barguzinensis]TDY74860.1 Xre family transcriptional regulator [Rhodobaca bogoriensis DSM 18756]
MTDTPQVSDSAEVTDWFSGDHATFGDRLTAARDAQGLSQAQLARRLGVKLKTVQGWENDSSEPRANKLQMVAGLLNVSIRWLLTGEGDGVPEPASTEELAEGAQALLKDVQQMRAQMTQLATRMGKAEKQLRLILKEAF